MADFSLSFEHAAQLAWASKYASHDQGEAWRPSASRKAAIAFSWVS